ncbi:MAG: hypothetical protein Q8P02_00415 [Candidatus Micrarchaeota archaeon]|nr:hypothetical protein [Candidatus Micrarchaeota archaeon]
MFGTADTDGSGVADGMDAGSTVTVGSGETCGLALGSIKGATLGDTDADGTAVGKACGAGWVQPITKSETKKTIERMRKSI